MDFSADSSLFLADSPHSAAVGFSDPVPVLYDAPFQKEAIYESQVETSSPACSMLDADVAALCIAHETSLTVRKQNPDGSIVTIGDFRVEGIEPDGLGMTRLVLTRDN